MTKSYYVASRASIPERSAMWRALRDSGVRITSTWIDEAEEGKTDSFYELWLRIVEEIRQADELILYVERDDFPLKGALVEVGIAIAMKKIVWVVAPNVEIQRRSMRPIGSWAHHPQVRFSPSVVDVIG